MSLDDIRGNLYKKNAPKNLSEHDKSEYNPADNLAEDKKENVSTGEEKWQERKVGFDQEEKKAISKGVFALAGIILVIVIIVAVVLIERSKFTDGNAFVTISGSQQVNNGEALSYEIEYKNENRGDLEGAFIRITYPENFKPENNSNFEVKSSTTGLFNVGNVKGKSSGKIVFKGSVYSPKGSFFYLKADFGFKPKSVSSQFEVNSQIGVSVSASTLVLEALSNQNVSSGGFIEYQINYKNEGNEVVDDISIKVDYPEGFDFTQANPNSTTSNNVWYIGNLEPGQEGKIIISGSVQGERNNTKLFKAYAGVMEGDNFIVYNQESAGTRITDSPLEIIHTVNGLKELNVNTGDTLSFHMKYKNTGTIGLRDVIIIEKLDSLILDYSSLSIKGGDFDMDSKTITWKAADFEELRNLEAGQGGEFRFSISVQDILPISSYKDKNFTISSIATIDSPDVPTPVDANKTISSNEVKMKVNSKLVLNVKGYYDDLNIPNSGPIPPKVGEETTYTLHWKVLNISNDISETKVTADIPTNTVMTGKIYPEDARIDYNPRSNSVTWTIGNVDAGTGVILDPLEVAFQVRIKPSVEQLGREVNILEKSTITAKDNFTQQRLEKIIDPKTTNLFEDPATSGKKDVVN